MWQTQVVLKVTMSKSWKHVQSAAIWVCFVETYLLMSTSAKSMLSFQVIKRDVGNNKQGHYNSSKLQEGSGEENQGTKQILENKVVNFGTGYFSVHCAGKWCQLFWKEVYKLSCMKVQYCIPDVFAFLTMVDIPYCINKTKTNRPYRLYFT